MSKKSHETLVPFLQPLWAVRGQINEVLVDRMGDDSHRRSAAFMLYAAAFMSAVARALAVGPGSGAFELIVSGLLAYSVLRIAEPIIKYRHDMKFPDIAITPYVGVLGLILKLIVGIRLYTVLNTATFGGNLVASLGSLASLMLFQVAMVVVLDDGERPVRRAYATLR